MKIVTKPIAGISLLFSSSIPAAAYDLPANLPARKPGLWEMRTTGTVGPNQLKDIKRYCLDAKADRALQELKILRKEQQVVFHDISCQAPKFSLAGEVLAGEMACRTNSQDDDDAAGNDFRWTTTFRSESEVVEVEHSGPNDVPLLLEIDLVEEQRWIGECPAGQTPGDGIDVGFTYNSDAWPDEAQPVNIYESLAVSDKLLKEGVEINKRLGAI
ncbi:hypothetical protein C7441_10916 [Pseudaminobacter salicylatoxidans]|uniref:DUF3617 family protein n=1 Tax=Pseudaminobacter salicylatoxidans TaxID=93369 RepID=A0A316C105_PSESE|nr:DUF3617 family protein [Pseudaminobacter salicylatoxidans]PWJ82250.1 hypothetical protein C7441_10916 [Pseudaminobacter salicylatoxidans]